MILAAGLGTRLRPITDFKPKALVEVQGVPLLEIVIRRLIRYHFRDIIVNVHHHADQIIDFLKKKNNFNINIVISDESQEILDTGGGIKKAQVFFDDDKPFLVHNADVLTNLDLRELYHAHCINDALATLLVRHREGSRFFLFENSERLCGWENIVTGEKKMAYEPEGKTERLAFSCIHVIDPKIFPLITESGCFSIVDTYLRLAADHAIDAFVDDKSYWLDVGTPEKLKKGEKEFNVKKEIR